MELLTYSTDPMSKLNKTRLELWCAKEALAEANRKNDNEMRGRAMRYINKDRTALRELAYALRAKLPASRVYKISMISEETERHCFSVFETASSGGKACALAEARYPHFKSGSVE